MKTIPACRICRSVNIKMKTRFPNDIIHRDKAFFCGWCGGWSYPGETIKLEVESKDPPKHPAKPMEQIDLIPGFKL